MYSVMRRVKDTKQPRGGYIKPKDFKVFELNDGKVLFDEENIHAVLIGLAVEYLTRFTMGTSLENTFRISLRGASNVKESSYAKELLNEIHGLDDKSIDSTCKLVGFDVAFRSGISGYKPVHTIQPDSSTISNIRIMVERSMTFINNYGPIVKDGFTFEGGYTNIISSGDGDFLTRNTLWDFKVSKNEPTNKHTLQLLIYYLMGIHSIHDEFQEVDKIGIFNPKLNKVYILDIKDIPSETIVEVSKDVIGY
ncbi:hypothetical protein [Niallia circulans]|uniref:hypothetical protein n=1 Tax=Niallia circulans TaxID=1397 RepID=UPI003512DF21